jgi:outer membrane protein assembly factor BamB
MELTNRVTRITALDGGGLLAADVTGRVHLLDDDLRLVRSSPVGLHRRPLYTVAAAGGWAVGKDLVGNVLRWSLPSLDLVDSLDAHHTRDDSTLMPDEEPSPIISRGIAIWDGKVYVNNGYRQLLVLDLESFAIERIVPSMAGDVAVEWISTEHPDVHAVSDKAGRLFLGRLDTLDFPNVFRLDLGNLHRVCYDRRHDRFWVTQDEGEDGDVDIANGVVLVRPDGTVVDRLRFARDDVEFLAFSRDGATAYAGGFDGVLHVFDNTRPELTVKAVVSGFPHQLSDLAVGRDDALYVLTQDGQIVKLDAGLRAVAKAPFRRQCVWDVQPALDDPQTLYCAVDDGVVVVRVEHGSAEGPVLRPVEHHVTGYGFTRRVVAVPGGWIGVTRDRYVVRADHAGKEVWARRMSSLAHTLAVDPRYARVLVATNDGGVELDAATGEPIGDLTIDGISLWACAYLPDGGRVLATREGAVVAFAASGTDVRWRVDIADYPKRMWFENGKLYLSGGGGIRELAPDGSGVSRQWNDLLSNTCENGVLVDGLVCAVSYDLQLLAYEYGSGELVGLREDRPDFPKAMAMVRAPGGEPFLVVGGRSGYLTVYRLDKGPESGTFAELRTVFLPRTALPSVLDGELPVNPVSPGSRPDVE